jgi:hypothetical protein
MPRGMIDSFRSRDVVQGRSGQRKGTRLAGLAMLGLLLLGAGGAQGKPPKLGQLDAGGKKQCGPGDTVVKMDPMEAKLKCKEGFHECEGELPLKAKNCTGQYMEFTKLELYEHDRRTMEMEFSPTSIVPPGLAWKTTIPWTTPGEVQAVVYYRTPGEKDSDTVRAVVKVSNKTLDDAMAACEKCNGKWGRYGINATEGCNCRPKDAGKVCTDGDQCKGQCMFERFDNTGKEYGKCSDTERVTGCWNIVQHGASKYPPRLPIPRKLPTCL